MVVVAQTCWCCWNADLTGIQVTSHICDTFRTSFVLELVVMSVFWSRVTYDGDYESSAPPLQQQVFNDPRSLKCEGSVRLKNSVSSGFFWTICLFFRSQTSTMAAVGPAPSKFMTSMVEPWIFGELVTSSIGSQRSGCKGLGGGLQNSSRLR